MYKFVVLRMQRIYSHVSRCLRVQI